MKKYVHQKTTKFFLLTLMLAGLFSFTSFAGGDTYEIYLNGKLMCKQSYKLESGSTDLQLANLNANDKLMIKYSHCGQVGQNRSIVIKDEKGNTIKEWKFTDTKNNQSVMQISGKELLALKAKYAVVKLYYSAKQLPQGRMLASIKIYEKKTAYNNSANKSSAVLK